MKFLFNRHFETVLLLTTFILLTFTFNNRSYLLVFLLFGTLLFLRGTDLIKILFFTLLLALPFERGLRAWHIPIVSPGPEAWMQGYNLYFGISLKYLIAFALLLLFLFSEKRRKRVKADPLIKLLLGFLGFGLVSTALASRFGIAALGFFRLLYVAWLFIVGRVLFEESSVKEYFQKYSVYLLLFLGLIGSLQFITRQPLGLFLENQLVNFPFGIVTSEGEAIYRVTGLIGHPTFFGSFLSMLIPISLGVTLQKISEKKRAFDKEVVVAVAAFSFGTLAIFGTFSRSSWFATFLSVAALLLLLGRLRKSVFGKSKVLLGLIGGFGLFVAMYGALLVARLKSLAFIWSLGTGKGRLSLIGESFEMMRRFPLFGTGLNHFPEVMLQQNVSDAIRGFIYPVHNTFLLFFAEIGIPAGFLFIVFVTLVMLRSAKKAKKSWINTGVLIGAATFLINAQFHTLFNQDPALDIFIILLSYLVAL